MTAADRQRLGAPVGRYYVEAAAPCTGRSRRKSR